ncbi:MAG TPA: hypothetical protein V6C81_15315 [Planktothrix sp.]
MSDTQDSELGRSKASTTPADHLNHLLTIGWSPVSPLILKYVGDHGLQRQLADWQAVNTEAKPAKKR